MGLKEKQAIAALDFSWSENRIKEVTGSGIKITLDAESFANDMNAIEYADSRGAEKIANGIAKVCYNDMGKDAFAEKKVDQIVLKNQPVGSRSITFEGSKLVVAFSFPDADDFFSESEIKDLIENAL